MPYDLKVEHMNARGMDYLIVSINNEELQERLQEGGVLTDSEIDDLLEMGFAIEFEEDK